ncbi:hypothetical protein BC739_000453 [Kutzneria viridogrisea]|uniref:Uncharacterized protein n=2 Tax=Kutzneria TaxID=43356 RepID=W5WEL6_9PSEU|nr:hypothetical protein KALB_5829 [Kutzneria albida DSM 43870]MBA8923256.1 hypothetical protein [Kutzneria viridogrisea]
MIDTPEPGLEGITPRRARIGLVADLLGLELEVVRL